MYKIEIGYFKGWSDGYERGVRFEVEEWLDLDDKENFDHEIERLKKEGYRIISEQEDCVQFTFDQEDEEENDEQTFSEVEIIMENPDLTFIVVGCANDGTYYYITEFKNLFSLHEKMEELKESGQEAYYIAVESEDDYKQIIEELKENMGLI